MTQHIGLVTYMVRESDEAIAWFTRVLGFEVVEDTPLGPAKRWVVVAPASHGGAQLLLARAANPKQVAAIGHQAGAEWRCS